MNTLSLFDLSGKKVLITGAGVGIGRGYALAQAGAGADIAMIDVNETSGRRCSGSFRHIQ